MSKKRKKTAPKKPSARKTRQSEQKTRTFHPELRILGIFALVFLIGQTVYRVFRDAIWPVWTVALNAKVSAWLINLITPGEKVVLDKDILISQGFSVQIKPGCDGMDAMILLAAAVIAFPMPGRQRLWGLGIGLFLLYAANIIRTMVLYYSAKYEPEIFDFMHIYVGQTFIILIACLFFFYWISRPNASTKNTDTDEKTNG
jgi:exosortase family protein XrtM